MQPTDDIMLLSGGNSRQTIYKQQDSRLTSKHLETALIYNGNVEPTQGGTVYTTKAYPSLKLFDLRSENSLLLYQILFKCDLPSEGRPDTDCRC